MQWNQILVAAVLLHNLSYIETISYILFRNFRQLKPLNKNPIISLNITFGNSFLLEGSALMAFKDPGLFLWGNIN